MGVPGSLKIGSKLCSHEKWCGLIKSFLTADGAHCPSHSQTEWEGNQNIWKSWLTQFVYIQFKVRVRLLLKNTPTVQLSSHYLRTSSYEPVPQTHGLVPRCHTKLQNQSLWGCTEKTRACFINLSSGDLVAPACRPTFFDWYLGSAFCK